MMIPNLYGKIKVMFQSPPTSHPLTDGFSLLNHPAIWVTPMTMETPKIGEITRKGRGSQRDLPGPGANLGHPSAVAHLLSGDTSDLDNRSIYCLIIYMLFYFMYLTYIQHISIYICNIQFICQSLFVFSNSVSTHIWVNYYEIGLTLGQVPLLSIIPVRSQ